MEQQDGLICSFMEICVIDCEKTAVSFLKATNWNLDRAVDMFYLRREPPAAPAVITPSGWEYCDVYQDYTNCNNTDARVFKNYQGHLSARLPPQELGKQSSEMWKSNESGESAPNPSTDDLASLYCPPLSIMFDGDFYKAKAEASLHNKRLIVNVQSLDEFRSHMLNRDIWSDDAVKATISTGFIFWQVSHREEEGMKVCNYYNLVTLPAVLIIDPITGQKLCGWSKILEPQDILEALLPYMERGPNKLLLHSAKLRGIAETSDASIRDKLAHSPLTEEEEDYGDDGDDDDDDNDLVEQENDDDDDEENDFVVDEDNIEDDDGDDQEDTTMPPLPEEPKVGKELICRVGIRLPDGRRLQRNFLNTDPINLLWSLCCSQLEEETKKRAFRLVQMVPGSEAKSLFAGSNLTFEEANLSNSLLSLMWL